MPKFTPGPWVAICGPEYFHNGSRLVTADVCTEWTRGHKPERGYDADESQVNNVSVASVGTFQDDLSVEELHANARLIAASPDYDALARKLVEHADAEFDDPQGIADLVEEARALIAKVDGEQS